MSVVRSTDCPWDRKGCSLVIERDVEPHPTIGNEGVNPRDQSRTLRLRHERRDIRRGHRLPAKGRELRLEGLSRPRLFTRNAALRNRTLLDWPEWFSSYSIEGEEHRHLRCDSDRVDLPTTMVHRHQLWCGIQVVVAKIVMRGLEVPEALAGAGVQCEEGVPEEPRPDAICTVEVLVG
jgi:hypothetical protein